MVKIRDDEGKLKNKYFKRPVAYLTEDYVNLTENYLFKGRGEYITFLWKFFCC